MTPLGWGGIAAAVAVPVFAIGTVVMGAAGAQEGALLAAGATNGGVCVPDARLAPPGPSAGRTAGLSGGQVARAAYAAGWRGADLVIAVAVAKAESDWNPTARNENTNGSTDLGLFQVNTVHAAILATGDPMDPTDNARMAYQVWTDAGGRWGPWVTYWRGTYKEFLADAQAAVGNVASVAASTVGCSATLVTAGGLSDPGPGPQAANGYTPRGENVRALTRARWGCSSGRARPCVSTIGGYAKRMIAGTSTSSDHASGNAADIMLGRGYGTAASQALGAQIAEFWMTNAQATGVKYVIFSKRIWYAGRDPVRPFSQWRPYCHPGAGCNGGDTLMHVDHVHVSVKG